MATTTPHLFPVMLSAEQRARLEDITRNGHAAAKKIRHAQVLLWSDRNREGGHLSRSEIAERLEMHPNTVDRIRKRFVQEGEAPAIERKARQTPSVPRKIDGNVEAHLIAICCGPAPAGRTRWTLKLLAAELKKQGLVTHVCAETVRATLQKTTYSRGASNAGAFPSATRRDSWPRWSKSSMSMPTRIAKPSR